jgi:hypothetical protein
MDPRLSCAVGSQVAPKEQAATLLSSFGGWLGTLELRLDPGKTRVETGYLRIKLLLEVLLDEQDARGAVMSPKSPMPRIIAWPILRSRSPTPDRSRPRQ